MRKIPPFSALRAFEAAARLMSFTAAASELRISQSAVSHQVRQLEEYLDSSLFIRYPRRLELSTAGRSYLKSVSGLLDELESATAQVMDDVRMNLRVCATPAFAARWLTPRMQRFTEMHGITLTVSTGLPPTDFSRGGFDVVIHWGAAPVEDLIVEPFMATPKIAVCSPKVAKRLSAKGAPGLTDETLLLDEVDDCWSEWLEGAGVGEIDLSNSPTFAHCELAISAAERDQGVVLAYRALVEDDLNAGRLVQVFPHETRDKVIYSVAYPINRRFSRKILAFRDWVFEEIQQPDNSETPHLSALSA